MIWLILTGVSCDDDSGPVGPEDKTPPTVQSTIPANGSSDVAIDRNIFVFFNEEMRSTGISSSTVTLSPTVTGLISVDSHMVIFDPVNDLEYETTYNMTVDTSAADLAGNKLASPYQWSFTTEPDPAGAPPVVTSTTPTNGATGVDPATDISASFSKPMDHWAFNDTTMVIAPTTSGDYIASLANVLFNPDDTLEFLTEYTVTLTTVLADTFGINMTSDYTWSFTTGPDPYIPIVSFDGLPEDPIIDSSNLIAVDVSHPVGVARVEFYVDFVHDAGGDDFATPFEYTWDASAYEIGSQHTIHAIAYDSDGKAGYSDTVIVTYLWEEIATDADDLWPTDIFRVFARPSDSMLELRYEMYDNWGPVPTEDTSLFLGVYFDIDKNPNTGRRDFDGQDLNGVGAEYRSIIGLFGLEALAENNGGSWSVLGGPELFAYYNVPADTNILEYAIYWDDLGNPFEEVRIVSINVFFQSVSSYLADWVPNQGSAFNVIKRLPRYIGDIPQPTAPQGNGSASGAVEYPNPFDTRTNGEEQASKR